VHPASFRICRKTRTPTRPIRIVREHPHIGICTSAGAGLRLKFGQALRAWTSRCGLCWPGPPGRSDCLGVIHLSQAGEQNQFGAFQILSQHGQSFWRITQQELCRNFVFFTILQLPPTFTLAEHLQVCTHFHMPLLLSLKMIFKKLSGDSSSSDESPKNDDNANGAPLDHTRATVQRLTKCGKQTFWTFGSTPCLRT
jgi:hypothetical protein